jgi:hypothetical protein
MHCFYPFDDVNLYMREHLPPQQPVRRQSKLSFASCGGICETRLDGGHFIITNHQRTPRERRPV